MKKIIFCALLLVPVALNAQKNKVYKDSVQRFRENYISSHEAVKAADRKSLSFYDIDESFSVNADIVLETGNGKVMMRTSAGTQKEFFKYAKATFTLKGKSQQLYLYKSPSVSQMPGYENYLFLPFTDLTNGQGSYGGGRYIDIFSTEIRSGKLLLDFNKCYNPYCAYATGYQCPIPPRENNLDMKVTAGEKVFKKDH